MCNDFITHHMWALTSSLISKRIFEKWDPHMGRPVSANPHDFGNWSTNYTILDLIGLDYPCAHGPCYDHVHTIAPTYPIIGSEMGSTTSDRSIYPQSRNVSKARGDGGAVPENVASMARSAGCWEKVLDLPYVSGAFEWSGFDYKGEPVPNEWPDVNSHFGFLDIAGFMKERGHWQRVWLANPEPPAIHVFPHWNWETGMNITVFAFSNVPGGSIELSLNGQSLGNRTITKVGAWVTWDVPYTPGTLTAQAYRDNSSAVCAQTSVATTDAPAALRLSIRDGVGATGIALDGADVALIMAEVVDAKGRVVPVASNVLSFSVNSTWTRIIGTGNGNPASHTPDKSPTREAFNGLAIVIVQTVRPRKEAWANDNVDSAVMVSVSSPGLQDDSIAIELLPAADQSTL